MATDPKAIAFASDVQGEAFGYGPHPMCMSGGWGSGKTWLGCMKGLFLSTTYPKNRGVICRHVGKELRETTMATFYKICPPHLYSRRGGGRRNDQQGYVRLITGSEILFLHLDDPQTEGVIRGLEANWMLIDQAEENADHMEELFDLLFGRMGRWDVAEVPDAMIEAYAAAGKQWPYMHPETGKPTPPSYVMLACNPDVETHWIYRRFHPDSLEWQRKYKAQGYRMFHMPSTDNKFLPKENLEKLLAQDESFQRRNVRGEWGNPEGTIHAVSPLSEIDGTPELVEYLLQTCTLFRSMDYGDSAPTCVLWWAVDRNGNVICFREYYQPNLVISVHRSNIAALSRDEFYEMNLADPSIFHKMPTKQGGRWCVADEYCLAPETKILTADLRHVPLSSIAIGDHLAGFDEGPTSTKFRQRDSSLPARSWRTADVLEIAPVVRPSYRLEFDDGTVIVCSGDHKWLSSPTGGWRLWRTTDQLRVGQSVVRAVDVWTEDTSHDGGYLAAAFDGEGFVTQVGGTHRLGFSQRPNMMLARVQNALDARGIRYGRTESPLRAANSTIVQLTVTGSRMLKVLGMVRPSRLLPRFDWDRQGLVRGTTFQRIVSKEYIGPRELIALKTSTRTCIAEGLMSHNCECTTEPRKTAIWWSPADNNELGTRNRINEYLRVDQDRLNPFTRTAGSPRLFFVKATDAYPEGCVQSLRQLRAQRRLKIGTDLGKPIFSDERDPTIVDHGYDPTRYFLASRPPAPADPRILIPGTFQRIQEQAKAFRKQMTVR